MATIDCPAVAPARNLPSKKPAQKYSDYKLVEAKSLTLTILLAGVMVIAIVITANFSSAAGQQVHGDYLVRIPQGATEPEGVHHEAGHIAIPAGTTVVWSNDDPGQPHTVTSDVQDSDKAGFDVSLRHYSYLHFLSIYI